MIISESHLNPKDLHSAIARHSPLVSPNTTIMAAIALMGETGADYVLVVENLSQKKGVIGILTERDLVRIITQPIPLDQLPIQAMMSHPVITIQESTFTDINEALALLQQHRIRHLPVLDDGDRLVGLVDQSTLIEMANIARHQQAEAALHQLNQSLERKVEQRTAALKARKATIRTILDTIPDLLLRLQCDGTCLAYINSGIEADDFLPIVNHISEVLPPKLVQKQLQVIEQAITTGELQVYEHHFLKQNRVVYEEVRILAINDQEVLAIVRNITARKLAEAELQQLNRNLERRGERREEIRNAALQQNVLRANEAQHIAHLGDWELDLLNQQLIWSAEIFRIFGLDPNQPDPTYEQALNYYPLDDRQRVIDLVDRVIQYGEPFETELRIIRADGSVGYTFTKGKPIWDASGQVIGLLGIMMDISDRKVIQEALRHSEERTQATLLALPDLVFRVNSEGKYIDFLTSPHGKNLVDPQQVIGKSIFDSLPADIIPLHSEAKYTALQKALATQTLQTYEQQVWINGELRYEEVRVSPCNNNEVVFLIRDISDRKLVENALLESQQFIQTVVDTVPLALFWKNRESVYLGCNQQFAKVVGLKSAEEVIGKTDFDLPWTPVETIAYQKDDQSVMKSGTSRSGIEETMTLANGEQRWMETHKAPLRDWTDHIIGVVGITKDVTIRRQIEARLKYQAEQERILGAITQRMRASLDLTEILKATVEDVREVLQSDRVLIYQLILGEPRSALAESTASNCSKILNVVFPDEALSQESYDYYAQGGMFILCDREADDPSNLPHLVKVLTELQVRAALAVPIIQNQILWGLLIVHQCDSPRHWQDMEINLLQQIANWLAIAIQQASLHRQLQSELLVRQHTEIKLTTSNQELSNSNEELGRATRLKDEFLANMSHELRTPLNSILGMSEALQDQIFGTINEKQRKAIQAVERSGEHLLALINDILDVAKIESGLLELDCAPTNVDSLCQSSLAFIKQQALKKRIQLEIKLPKNLPDQILDERRIRQVLINLLNNAMKFTLEGGRITLEVQKVEVQEVENTNSWTRFSVTDTGIGIAPENVNKLFQPFIQIDSALNRQYDGTGLGLALVKQMAELHGGKIGLTSELGVGSCFTIDLPYLPSEPEMRAGLPTNAIPKRESLSSLEATHSPLILMAEDNEANTSSVGDYLEAKGYRLLLAKNGEEAIALAKSHQPDLILMDIQMPIMDGLEATKQIRLDPNLVNIPIIALTALAMVGDREKCLAAGANDYLSKPIKLKQLTHLVQSFLLPSP
ncbi:PAS domain-containing protein [Pseudanabaena sp. FACHB-1998]|uniref:PAS domain-containing protein n=1 Tax=Pseudanabaena sp. FACHB-1998 TaxID=2692858 RepID=UPI0016807AEF|nr:PAS domain-containing protein [Pseudanabaena sp. FACHB-1998]MBD2178962.1 PAS domain-containing protein [Pseudanabaena sp. FACHB-1998]